ncbi:hypothetical protein H310_02421 [Aphanomyces invadans]|uniref:Vms1-associating treble clef domain-containing protein n=1 Tax=Aphanomyces invadans TaxID=157072 RepID=A0A024UQD7_9STRA|nr:hypothetical protein H310_02421 [Aphanomyces invadans]ETW08052.1 hypothetical protein H310_02421 [Aphanomyces invadans]|eukprot:XP_008864145.1 hypothetical protein H310_02421 [Aphanomyces invadans]
MTDAMIMTVRGEVPASAIKGGGILVHQRVLEKESSVADVDIAMEDLMFLREHPMEKGNLMLSSETRAFRELERLAHVQSNCVVDIHGRETRDVKRLKRMSEQLDLHILAATSVDVNSPDATNAAALTQLLVLDLQYGIDNSTIQASIIYQRMPAASLANPSILQAISNAQRVTNAPVYFSFEPHSPSLAEVQTFLDQYRSQFGGHLHRVVLCHCDVWWQEPAALQRVAATTGVYLSFDLLGLSAVSDAIPFHSWSSAAVPRDFEIASCVQSLLATHSSRILLSSTITQTIQYHRCGGGGMVHALTSFKTKLFGQDLTPEQQELWTTLIFQNPLTLLQGYIKPPPAALPKDYLTCSICRHQFEPIVGEYYTKFEFVYCSTKCLRRHRNASFAPIET